MRWNYRVIRFVDPESPTGYRFELKEVYYEGKEPQLYGDPYLTGDSLDEIQEVADRLLNAVSKPVLEETAFLLGIKL